MSAKATSSTARKIIGSLGVVGAAAAVAGMGTFGAFTDSSTPVAATINSGTLSINAAQPTGAVAMNPAGLVPGDTATRALNVVNDGNTDFGTITLDSAAKTSSVLTSNVTLGLQMSVESCEVPWTQVGTTAPTFTCSKGKRTVIPAGPAVTNRQLTTPYALAAGKTDYLAVSFTLPVDADNTFQGQKAELDLSFTATQRTATNR